LGQFLGEGRKLETGGFSLWKDVMDGDGPALSRMIKYCKQDVKLLEKVYLDVRRYAPATVHMGVVAEKDRLACKACGSLNGKWDGTRIKTKIEYRCRKCHDCGHFFRSEIRV